MIRLIALDIDGTLTGDDGYGISRRVRKAISRAQERGIEVTLATGRMFSSTLPYAETLGIDAPLICYQGGWIQAPGGEVLYRIPLDEDLARSALAVGRERDWHTVLYADGQLFLRRMVHPRDFYERLLGLDPIVIPSLPRVLDAHTADKVLYVADPDQIPEMARALTQRFGETTEVVQSHVRFVELVPREVNKGRALAWLADHLHVVQAEVMAVGDQQNDVSMLRWAGIGVAMGNAVEAARAAADRIAPTVAEDGAAVALERWALTGTAR